MVARLKGIQRAMENHYTKNFYTLESALMIELEDILEQEESLWMHKSICEWISSGDRNIHDVFGSTEWLNHSVFIPPTTIKRVFS